MCDPTGSLLHVKNKFETRRRGEKITEVQIDTNAARDQNLRWREKVKWKKEREVSKSKYSAIISKGC